MGTIASKLGKSKNDAKYSPLEGSDEDSLSDGRIPKFVHGQSTSIFQQLRNSRIMFLLMLLSIYLLGWFTRVIIPHTNFEPLILAPNFGATKFAVIPVELTYITEEKVFWSNHTFDIDREDEDANRAWDTYFSRFISLDDDVVRENGLPPSTRSPEGRQVYSVAAYHHLHCLHVIGNAWRMLKSHGPDILDEPYPGLESFAEGYTYEGHVSHCLDMVRQALECHADPTLEPMLKDDGLTGGGRLASGWGGTAHLCRNFKALTGWIDSPEQNPVVTVEALVGDDHDHAHGHGGSHGHKKF